MLNSSPIVFELRHNVFEKRKDLYKINELHYVTLSLVLVCPRRLSNFFCIK